MISAAAQATIRTADGAAILIDQRNNLPKQMERQGGWSELVETGDGPRLWRGPSKGRKKALGGGQCLRRVTVWEGPRRWRGCTAERGRRREHRDDRMQLRVDRTAGAALIETREMEEERPGGL